MSNKYSSIDVSVGQVRPSPAVFCICNRFERKRERDVLAQRRRTCNIVAQAASAYSSKA
jgi:hypothetical protein